MKATATLSPGAKAAPAPVGVPPRAALLRRKCGCAGPATATGECGACAANKQLRRSARGGAEPSGVPPIVGEVLRGPGEPLPDGVRAELEPRFGHSFARVRVHTDARAAESAEAVDALAYTVGRDVVFGAGRYAPGTPAGRRLLAHELVHVLQQGESPAPEPALASAIPGPGDAAELEADRIADAVLSLGPAPHAAPPEPAATPGGLQRAIQPERRGPALMRSLRVDNPRGMIPNPTGSGAVQTNAQTIRSYLTTLCPSGGVTVDAGTGQVGTSSEFCTPTALAPGVYGPPSTPAQRSATSTSCNCICDLVSSRNAWTIEVNDTAWPNTVFTTSAGANGTVPGGSGGRVTAPSPNSPRLWGAATRTGAALDVGAWLVLGHELCGHGWLGDQGRHAPDEASPRGEGGHQATVARENQLRREHGIDERGGFKDPNCGESYFRDRAAPGTVNWSSFRAVCERWRQDYNRRHGTNYTITSRIP